jgi:hypothetical protein
MVSRAHRSKLHFLNFISFLFSIWLHASDLGKLNSQPPSILDWWVQGPWSSRQRTMRSECFIFFYSLWYSSQYRLYYENDPAQLYACPLTIHALHISWGIRVAGPVWTYWAYPMEHHCNTLLQSIKSRHYAYASIASFVTTMAQLDQIQLLYNICEELRLGNSKGVPWGVMGITCTPTPWHPNPNPRQVSLQNETKNIQNRWEMVKLLTISQSILIRFAWSWAHFKADKSEIFDPHPDLSTPWPVTCQGSPNLCHCLASPGSQWKGEQQDCGFFLYVQSIVGVRKLDVGIATVSTQVGGDHHCINTSGIEWMEWPEEPGTV